MSPREIELDEALEKYKKAEAEKPREPKAEEQKEFEKAQKEKRLKKPGSVSRFFNQFGVGKYWERMNDYFEQEEKMEKATAEKAAAKETVGDVKAAAEEKVGEVKKTGAEMPVKIESAAARAGAEAGETAPVVAEAGVVEAQIEQEAEAAKADLDQEVEDVEIVEKESMEDDIRKKYKDAPMRDIDVKIKNLDSDIGRETDPDLKDMLEAERDILVKIKKEKMPVKTPEKKIDVELPAWDEKEVEDMEVVEKESMEDELRRKYKDVSAREIDFRIHNLESQIRREKDKDLLEMLEAERDILAKIKKEKMSIRAPGKRGEKIPVWEETEELKSVKDVSTKDLPPIEEFKAVAREHEEQAVPSPEKVKAVDVLEEEIEEPAEEEMAKAKVEVKSLKNKKSKEEPEEISIDFDLKRGDKVPVIGESGKVEPGWTLVSFGKDKKTAMVTKPGKDGQPMLKTIDLEELKQWKREEEFFGKGRKESRKRMWRGVKSLAGARGEYAAQRKKKTEEAFKISEPEVKPETKKKPKPRKIKLKIAS
ncbi:MAG: hypothetical protein ABII19_00585 [Patescibacteria group bacterium]